MRAPDFWDRDDVRARIARAALAPFGALYSATVQWKSKHAVPYRARVPVICVGNISSGGTGKTPIAISIAERLAEHGRHPAFLSRGYGGRLQGPVLVSDKLSAAEVGDEPLLLARAAPTVVACDRRAGAEYAEAMGYDVIVMDDGHQNFSLAKDVSIVVVDGEKGFGNGRVLPAGPLRETIDNGLIRADAVILMGDGDPDLRTFGGPVLRARLEPPATVSFEGRRMLAFAGIGRPEKFFKTLQHLGADLAGMIAFPDHHPYSADEIAHLKIQAQDQKAQLITTEKDFVRVAQLDRDGVAVLPVRAVIEPKDALDRLLDSLIQPR